MTVLVAVYGPPPWNLPLAYVEVLRRRFPHVTFKLAYDRAAVAAQIEDVDVGFMIRLRPEALARAARLRWIHSSAASVAELLTPELVASPIVVTNSRGMLGPTIAEHVIGVTIALLRHFPAAIRAQAARRWEQPAMEQVRMLRGRRLGLVGVGGIGLAVADLAAAMGMRVSAVRRRIAQPKPASVEQIYPPADLPVLLADADVLVIAAPLTPQTRALIGTRELRVMKRDAVLVNVSRGALVNEAELAEELARGTIAGAALDVFEREPLAADSPLWNLPNVLITAHTSGYREGYWEAVIDLFSENLRRFERGDRLMNVVDKQAGY